VDTREHLGNIRSRSLQALCDGGPLGASACLPRRLRRGGRGHQRWPPQPPNAEETLLGIEQAICRLAIGRGSLHNLINAGQLDTAGTVGP
jgi:hypothetical protein